ncbi:hypothetical protein GUJ93_ZPchr0003g18104 [Zizania palustris]|uniref:Uncharacterized protein n=1 Tax=Zizania palustris TaxID=103762 RepID=A0A8J5RM62_ZIZPA|nr:hypothetical protein GUJ93_ZPchr0003g18104 [Zizania palustris]
MQQRVGDGAREEAREMEKVLGFVPEKASERLGGGCARCGLGGTLGRAGTALRARGRRRPGLGTGEEAREMESRGREEEERGGLGIGGRESAQEEKEEMGTAGGRSHAVQEERKRKGEREKGGDGLRAGESRVHAAWRKSKERKQIRKRKKEK